jgi:hypothetical protein
MGGEQSPPALKKSEFRNVVMLKSVFLAISILLTHAAIARADKLVVSIQQQQTAILTGKQTQLGDGGSSTAQTATLNQGVNQLQVLNIVVPDSFQGNVKVQGERSMPGQGLGSGRDGNSRGRDKANRYPY